jgi:hypothetical protein
MALKIIDARKSGFPHDGHFGYVHLIFDRDIDANPLRVSILKMIGREYLGESFPPKANWRPTRWHFFDAAQVARGDGESVFVLGPEVTSFIPDESMLEIASEDNSVREMAVWSGVSVDFSWKGPPPEAASARQTPPVASPVRSPPPPPAAMPVPPPPLPEPPSPAEASSSVEPPPPSLRATALRSLSPFAWVRQAKPDAPIETPPIAPAPEPEPPGISSAPEPEPVTQEVPEAPPLSLADQTEPPEIPPEPAATPPKPPPLPEPEAIASIPPEVPAEPAPVEEAEPPALPHDEPADVSVPSADIAPMLEPQPETGSTRATEPPPPVRNRAGRVAWAALIATVAILGGLLYVQQNRLELCSSYEALCDAETLEVTRAQQCSAIRDCGAWVCLTDYRKKFSNGRYQAVIDQISATKGAACPSRIDLPRPSTPSIDTSHADSSSTDASSDAASNDNSSDDAPRRRRRRHWRCRPGSTSPACLRRFHQQQQQQSR